MPGIVSLSTGRFRSGWSHFVVGLVALTYMWCISLTSLRQTGLQFVAPVLIIFAMHTIWGIRTSGIRKNVYLDISRNTLNTSVMLLFSVFLLTVLVPEPAHSSALEGLVASMAQILICLLIIVILCVVVGGTIYLLWLVCRWIYRWLRPESKNTDKNNTVNEIASIVLTGSLLLGASLEGVKGFYTFSSTSNASASLSININAARVWQTLETATQPEFPLPSILTVFPRPVDVLVDEGIALHANRVVRFEGREGEGLLRLRVTERSPAHVKFQVLSDSSPIANWVAHKSLTYRVTAKGASTQLTVVLDYDRLLAPAWFFNTLIGGATFLAMDVLARDVKARAEL